jgi:hypothetical protein
LVVVPQHEIHDVCLVVELSEQTHPKHDARVAVPGCTASSAVARTRRHVAGRAPGGSILRRAAAVVASSFSAGAATVRHSCQESWPHSGGLGPKGLARRENRLLRGGGAESPRAGASPQRRAAQCRTACALTAVRNSPVPQAFGGRTRSAAAAARTRAAPRTARPGEFLAALKRVAPPPPPQLEVGAKVELHSLNATEHNGKHGELLEYDAEAQRWAVER